MEEKPKSHTMIANPRTDLALPHRPIVVQSALLDEDRQWCREQLALAGRTLFDDWRNPYGMGPDSRWLMTEQGAAK